MNQGFSSRQNALNSTGYGYYIPYGYTNNKSDERLAGGFVFPFLLGGVTGAAVAPAFWNNGYNNRPIYYAPYPYMPYNPYPPRRWF